MVLFFVLITSFYYRVGEQITAVAISLWLLIQILVIWHFEALYKKNSYVNGFYILQLVSKSLFYSSYTCTVTPLQPPPPPHPKKTLQRCTSPDQGSVSSSLWYCNYIHMNPSCYKTIFRIKTKQHLTRLKIIKDSLCVSVVI